MSLKEEGIIIILSSPSGAGKTTISKILASKKNYKISVSHTTRKPRPNEITGEDYYFVNKKEFDHLISKNYFFEYAKIFGNFYGTLKEPVLKELSKGKNVLFDIDWQGTQQLKNNKNLSLVTFFVLPPNIQVLKKRLLNRHAGDEKIIEQRMKKFNEEISHWNEYNYVVINDELEACYKKILKIMIDEKKGISQKQNFDKIAEKVKELTK